MVPSGRRAGQVRDGGAGFVRDCSWRNPRHIHHVCCGEYVSHGISYWWASANVIQASDAWLENIKRYVDDDENISKENAKDCSDLGKECNILNGASCRDFFRGPKEPNNQWNNELWWIFRAVEGAHGKMQKLYNSLTEKTINTHLKMDQIAEDFEESKKAMISGGEAAEWISAVLGAGVGTLGLSSGATPGLGYAMDLLTSGVEMARSETAEEEELVSLADVKSSLADLFLKSRESLAFIARTAVGKPYQQDRDKAKAGGYSMWNRLPNFGEDYWDSQVANFYDNPFWLMDDTAEDVSSVIQVATEPLNVHVTDAVLRQLGYAVSWQSTISNKADCVGGRPPELSSRPIDRGAVHFVLAQSIEFL